VGLSVAVGVVGPAIASGDPGWEHLRKQVDELNRLLAEAGLPEHREPEVASERPLEIGVGPYDALHRLRRLAPDAEHLQRHSDHDGFFVPIPFDHVLTGSADGVGEVGSSYALRDELEALDVSGRPEESATRDALLEAAHASIERGALLLFS
jgi:hypothetical protein